jgi:hypothetical protein
VPTNKKIEHSAIGSAHVHEDASGTAMPGSARFTWTGEAMMNIRLWCAVLLLALAGCGGGGSAGFAPSDPQGMPSQASDIVFTASSTSVASGERVRLNWSATRADSCTASGDWSGIRPLTGEFQTPPITSPQSYTLSCNGAGGGAVARISIALGPSGNPGIAKQPSVQIRATPRGVAHNGSTTLSWETRNVDECTASGDWSGDKALTGTQQVNSITKDRSFRLSCKGADGSAVAMTSVTVREARLTWQPPKKNVDGSNIAKLAGYKIYWGTASRKYTESIEIKNPAMTSHVLKLTPGTHYFALTALTQSGEESGYSNEISKEVF